MHLKKEKIVKNTRSQKGLKVSVALSESQPTPVALVSEDCIGLAGQVLCWCFCCRVKLFIPFTFTVFTFILQLSLDSLGIHTYAADRTVSGQVLCLLGVFVAE